MIMIMQTLNRLDHLRCWILPIILVTGIWPIRPANASNPDQVERVNKNRIVICLPSGPDTLDPTNHRSRFTQIVLKNIFDSLTARDANNNVLPQLADSWKLINDTQWQFNLRRGVPFHNGGILTAADVKYTLDRIILEGGVEGHTSPRQSLLAPISEVIVKDDYTIFINTRFPWPQLPLMLSLQEIVPEAHMQALGSKGFTANPVGTGPFKFSYSRNGEEIVLERFGDYYGGSPLRPPVQAALLKEVVFKEVPSFIDQLAMMKSGQCDIMFNLPPESIPIAQMSPHLRVLKAPATRSYFAEINCSRPPFNDLRVRQALNHAVDMDAFIRHKLQGYATILPTVLLPNAFGFHPDLQAYAYNPSAARKLLDSASYPGSRPLAIYTNRDELIFADTIALYLTKLGLRTKILMSTSSRPQTKGPEAPWDIFVGSWGNSTLDPEGILPPKFKRNAYGNFSGIALPELDDLMIRANSTMNEGLRIKYYHQIQNIIYNEVPMIFGYAPDEIYVITKQVKNFIPSSSGMIELHDVYIETEE